ncbi:AraC family transcriptional regulator [Alistipes megaguti]|uniref:AraC family transcriptional regulator n=1 Tax=Alistipes megaguti TaxID=2364787 RepID=UPI003B5A5766
MLRHPGFNSTEIAEAAGFISPSHFTRIFKAAKGPPLQLAQDAGRRELPFVTPTGL